MISIDNKNIKISYGDTFNVLFKVYGYQFKDTDIVTFTVKKDINSDELISKTIKEVTDNTINVLVTNEEMEGLLPGFYVYDLVCQSEGVVFTLNYPSELRIIGVVHNEL